MSRDQAGDEDRRRAPESGKIPRKGLLRTEDETKLLELAGFTREELFERRGPTTERGLASFLEAGDEVLEVLTDHVRIRRKDGAVQTFWNLRRPPPWLRPVERDP